MIQVGAGLLIGLECSPKNLKEENRWSVGWSNNEFMFSCKCGCVGNSKYGTESLTRFHRSHDWTPPRPLWRAASGRGPLLRHMCASAAQQEAPWRCLPVRLTSHNSLIVCHFLESSRKPRLMKLYMLRSKDWPNQGVVEIKEDRLICTRGNYIKLHLFWVS